LNSGSIANRKSQITNLSSPWEGEAPLKIASPSRQPDRPVL